MTRTPNDKSPEEIQYLLNRAGWTFRAVDRHFGLTLGTASKSAGYPHLHGELAIAEALGLSPRQIWPSRYNPFGVRHEPQPTVNYKAVRRVRHCQKRRAA